MPEPVSHSISHLNINVSALCADLRRVLTESAIDSIEEVSRVSRQMTDVDDGVSARVRKTVTMNR